MSQTKLFGLSGLHQMVLNHFCVRFCGGVTQWNSYGLFSLIHSVFFLYKKLYICIYLKLWKPGLANLTFCLTFYNFSCVIDFLLCFSRLISGFFFCFLVRDLGKSGCRHNIGPRLFTTSGQHSPVRPSHWVSERLIFSFHFAKWVHEPDPGWDRKVRYWWLL